MLPSKFRRPTSAENPTGTICPRRQSSSNTSGQSPCQCHVRGTVIKLVAGLLFTFNCCVTYRSLSLSIAAWVQPVESVVFAEYSQRSRSLTLKVTLDGSRCSSRR